MKISTRKARVMRRAVVDALNLWMEFTGGPGTVGLYWRTYNRVRDEQTRRRNVALLAQQGRRNLRRHIEYVPTRSNDGTEES